MAVNRETDEVFVYADSGQITKFSPDGKAVASVEVVARVVDGQTVILELGDPDAPPVAAGDGSSLGRALQILLAGLPGSPGGAILEVRSSLPQAVGLGSSAALAVAVVRSLCDLRGLALDATHIARLANSAEAVFHGRPSGVDAAAATHGGRSRSRVSS